MWMRKQVAYFTQEWDKSKMLIADILNFHITEKTSGQLILNGRSGPIRDLSEELFENIGPGTIWALPSPHW